MRAAGWHPVPICLDTLSKIWGARVDSCYQPGGGLAIVGGSGRMILMAEQRRSTTPLSDLVRDQRAFLGLSLRALAAQCVDPVSGEQLVKYSWLERLEKREPVITPQLPQLRALAEGLRLPLQRLQDETAVQFLGLDRQAEWSADSSVRVVVDRMNELPPEKRAELAALADFYAAQERAKRQQ